MKIVRTLICLLLLCSIPLTVFGETYNLKYGDMTGFFDLTTAVFSPVESIVPVRIALIDSGVDTTRLDPYCFLPGRSYVTNNTRDLIGHGTHIASLIIGYENEQDSIPALAPNARIIPLVYQSKDASGVPVNSGVEGLCMGIYDAVDVFNAQVIVISSGVKIDHDILREAVEYAEEKGVIFISAAGNSGGELPYYPAAYPSVVAVGAVDENSEVTTFSTRNEFVTVAAPGKDLMAVSLDENYPFDVVSGTSYACAYVAAMAARLKGAHPDMTPAEFRAVLNDTSIDLGTPGFDNETGAGLVNLSHALVGYDSAIAVGRFTDVSRRDWFYDAVSFVHRNQFMSGISETEFAPQGAVTRAMLVTVLHRIEGEPIDGNAASFSDVRTGSYYEHAVGWAKEHGIISGVTELRFAPNDYVTREQIATIMYRYAQYKNRDVSVGENTNILSYEDCFDIAEYAIPAMQYVAGSGLMGGKTESTLNPKDKATRAEIATILQRFLGWDW